MQLELKVYNALCATEVFSVNGVVADKEDFGTQQDEDTENAEDYCCGDMRFTRQEPTKDVLEKYKITEAEYSQICDRLEEELSFGCCGWCS